MSALLGQCWFCRCQHIYILYGWKQQAWGTIEASLLLLQHPVPTGLYHTYTPRGSGCDVPNVAGLLMVLYPLLPETPYWLVLNGDLAAAETVLQRMARINGVPLPEVFPQVLAALLVELDIDTPRNEVCEV